MDLDYESPNITRMTLESDSCLIEHTALTEKYQNAVVPDNIYEELEGMLIDFVHIPFRTKFKLQKLYESPDNYLEMICSDWTKSLEYGAIRILQQDGSTRFPTRIALANGEALEVGLARNQDNGSLPWFMSYVPDVDSLTLLRDCSRSSIEKCTPADRSKESLPPALEERVIGMKQTEDYLEGIVPSEILDESIDTSARFSDFVWISQRWQEELVQNANKEIDPVALLDRDWEIAVRNRALRYYEGKILFPVSIIRADGETLIEVAIAQDSRRLQPNAESWLPWYVKFVDSFPKQRQAAGRALFDWAYIGNMNSLLSKLASAVLHETWTFKNEDDDAHQYSILKSYLLYTFYRLKTEGKILEDREKGIAAFNTGLVDSTYEPVYACFSPSTIDAPWRFEAFCRAGTKQWGKLLVRAFNPLPQRAEYFHRKEDLLFDPSKPLQRDVDHILLDNMERLPKEFLEEELRNSSEALDCIEKTFESEDESAQQAAYDRLREIVQADPRLKRRLINRLDDAIEVAQKRVEWNFKTAVPAFYPTKNTMSLLLPLDLTDNERPDVALVVELVESGAYIGQTILTMEMAYNNARLISRPDSDWLNTTLGVEV